MAKRGAEAAREQQIAERRRKNYVPPVWTSSRPKPQFADAAWHPQEEHELAKYVDWHGRHPHMVSPRDPKKLNLAKIPANLQKDEENPEFIYYPNQMQKSPEKPDFTPTTLGAHGNFEEASVVASVYERAANIAGGVDSEDPWYSMSVKDRLEQYHIDGDHTSVKFKRPGQRAKTKAQLEFEKEAKWQEEQYNSYGGGGPAFEGEKRRIIEALSLANPNAASAKTIVGPWEENYAWSRYTRDGSNLEEYNQQELERRVTKALETFRLMSASKPDPKPKKSSKDKLKEVAGAMSSMASLFAGKGDWAPVAPEAGAGEESVAEGQSLGGGTSQESQSASQSQDGGDGDDMSMLTFEDGPGEGEEESEKSGSSRRKKDKHQNKKKKRERDRKSEKSVDFVDELKLAIETIEEEKDGDPELTDSAPVPDPDARIGPYEAMVKKLGGEGVCEKKAAEWIKFAAFVRKKAKREQNLFDISVDLFDRCNQGDLVKVLFILGVQGIDPNQTTPEDEPLIIHMIQKIIVQDDMTGSLHDGDNESPDRVKLHRVVQALVRFQVQLDTLESKTGQGAIHLAAAANNSKLVTFLIENGVNPNQWDRSEEPTSALMIAAKFGFVQVIASLLRKGAKIDVKDGRGRTALHQAAAFGQTRTALFLLQCGADKRIKDKQGKSPGVLADEVGYVITSQQILCYTYPTFQSMRMLNFYADEFKALDAKKEAESKSIVGNAAKLFSGVEGQAAQALNKAGESFMAFVGSIITWGTKMGRRVLGLPPPSEDDNKPSAAK